MHNVLNINRIGLIQKPMAFSGSYKTQFNNVNIENNPDYQNSGNYVENKNPDLKLPGQRLDQLYKDMYKISKDAQNVRKGLDLVI